MAAARDCFPLPLREKVGSHDSEVAWPDEGVTRAIGGAEPLTRARDAAHRVHPLPQGERVRKNYTDAVVTPPSTTMVWPVMKLEASEPR